MRLPKHHTHAAVYVLTLGSESCALILRPPDAAARVAAEGAAIILNAKWERQQLEIAQYKLGKRASPPDTSFTLEDFGEALRFICAHVAEIEGLVDDDGTPLTREQVSDEVLCHLLLSCGGSAIAGALTTLITLGGLDDDARTELLVWLRQKLDPQGDYRLAARLFTRYLVYCDPHGACPSSAPRWVADVHAIVQQVKAEARAEEARIQEQKEIAKKLLAGR